MADFATDAAIAEASQQPQVDVHEASGTDGDNKFQKAISAWRSEQTQICVVARSANQYSQRLTLHP